MLACRVLRSFPGRDAGGTATRGCRHGVPQPPANFCQSVGLIGISVSAASNCDAAGAEVTKVCRLPEWQPPTHPVATLAVRGWVTAACARAGFPRRRECLFSTERRKSGGLGRYLWTINWSRLNSMNVCCSNSPKSVFSCRAKSASNSSLWMLPVAMSRSLGGPWPSS